MTAEQSPKASLWRIDLTGFVVCLGATFVAYSVGLSPLIQQRSALDAQRATLTEKHQTCSDLSKSLNILKQDVIGLRQNLEKMKVTLEPTGRLNHRMAALTDILGDCDMKIDTMNTGSINPGPYCSFVSVDIVGQSDYLHCIRAFHQLHQRLPDVALVGFRLQGAPEAPNATGQCALNLFWYAAPRPAQGSAN